VIAIWVASHATISRQTYVPKRSCDRLAAPIPRFRSARNSRDGARPEEPEFLGDDREHEIGVLGGQEVQLALGPLEQSLAGQPARSDRDLGLAHLIADPAGSRSASRTRGSAPSDTT